MNAGTLSRRTSSAGWVANRFYYQENIPRKDAAILSNCPDPEVRRRWIRRIIDHDGTAAGEGGIEAWLRLGEAVRADPRGDPGPPAPGARGAVRGRRLRDLRPHPPWVEAVASSLTELFAPDLMAERLAAFEQYYPWIEPDGLAYFRDRLHQAPRDCEHALEVVTEHCLHAGVAGARRGRAVVQVRRPVGHDGRDRPGAYPAADGDGTRLATDRARGLGARHVRLRFDRTRQRHVLLARRRWWC